MIPYTWNALYSPKDIIPRTRTVLLRLITSLSRTTFYPAKDYHPPPSHDVETVEDVGKIIFSEDARLAKVLNFLYSVFRSRIVPKCIALMQIKGEIRKNHLDPADFPVANWDPKRAKDGLV